MRLDLISTPCHPFYLSAVAYNSPFLSPSLCLSTFPIFQSSPPRSLLCLEKSRPRVPRRDRSRGPRRGVGADAPLCTSLHYTVKSNETRHLIPPRNVLSDCFQLGQPDSRARKTIHRARLLKKYKIPAYSAVLTSTRDRRRCTRIRKPPRAIFLSEIQ